SGGSLTTLYNFSYSDGWSPYAGLVQGSDGNFYGTTQQGGPSGAGTVFKITSGGSLTTLYSFSFSDGAAPHAGLVQGSDGNFYGTTAGGGASGAGTVFKITVMMAPTITANFNSTDIAAGNSIWFNAILKPKDLPAAGSATISLTNSTITFSEDGTPYVLSVPDAQITFTDAVTSASTVFSGGMFVTTVPLDFDKNVFLSGFSFQVPAGWNQNNIPVTWSGDFSSSDPKVSLQWKWGAAVYTTFSPHPTYNALGIKPVDGNAQNPYPNSDHAGTPENFKASLTAGARGGGGSNFTGSYSGTASMPRCTTP
ncbi:MAG: hypothetical protein M3542_09450, partial [Acidobacteriota bacterium]|nr:hypothetical protein [Acidobacteriota bacterium]